MYRGPQPLLQARKERSWKHPIKFQHKSVRKLSIMMRTLLLFCFEKEDNERPTWQNINAKSVNLVTNWRCSSIPDLGISWWWSFRSGNQLMMVVQLSDKYCCLKHEALISEAFKRVCNDASSGRSEVTKALAKVGEGFYWPAYRMVIMLGLKTEWSPGGTSNFEIQLSTDVVELLDVARGRLPFTEIIYRRDKTSNLMSFWK